MRFLVKFEVPVWYLPDHPSARRLISDLVVNSDSPSGALIHAIRTVSGDVTGATVEPFTGIFGHLPIVEPDAAAVPQSFSVQ